MSLFPGKLVTTKAAWQLHQELKKGGASRDAAIGILASLDNLSRMSSFIYLCENFLLEPIDFKELVI